MPTIQIVGLKKNFKGNLMNYWYQISPLIPSFRRTLNCVSRDHFGLFLLCIVFADFYSCSLFFFCIWLFFIFLWPLYLNYSLKKQFSPGGICICFCCMPINTSNLRSSQSNFRNNMSCLPISGFSNLNFVSLTLKGISKFYSASQALGCLLWNHPIP